MIFLTSALISHATAARRRLRTAYAWHQAVWEAFPDLEHRDFLTRLDATRQGYRLLLTSLREPTRPPWCSDQRDIWQTRTIPEGYFRHTHYGFQLLANPTRKVAVPSAAEGGKTNGKRVALRTRQELEAWIERKGEQHGFRLQADAIRILNRGVQWSYKSDHACTHSMVEFRGILEVTDGQRFVDAFVRGIGSAKAFGFGLLLVKPVQVNQQETLGAV